VDPFKGELLLWHEGFENKLTIVRGITKFESAQDVEGLEPSADGHQFA